MMLYNQAGDESEKKRYGDIIFNKIMPIAHELNPILLKLIPEKTKQQFHIEFSTSGQIKSWQELEHDSSATDSAASSDENSRDSGLSSGSPQHDKSLTSSDNEEGESSIIGPYSNSSMLIDMDETALLNNDMSQITSIRGGIKKKIVNGMPNGMPQHHLTGKHKSLINQLLFTFPH